MQNWSNELSSNNTKEWRLLILACSNIAALLLFASWLFEPTRSLWMDLDTRTFWAMNNSLSWNKSWQTLWAIANNRAFDLVAALSIALIFAHQALWRDRQHLSRYIAIGLMMILTVVLMMQIGKMIPIERPSATVDFPEALRLSQLVPDISTKDLSGDSFPGDHGLVLLLAAGFAVFYLPLPHGLLALFVMVIMTVPRLMSGAHWLTDEIVGATSLGVIALSWLFATPLHRVVLEWLERRVIAVRGRFRL